MKTRNIFIAAGIILIAGSALFSCQKEHPQAPEKEQAMLMMKDLQADAYFTYSNNPVCLGDPVTISFNNCINNACGVIKIQEWNPVTAAWELVAGPITPVNGQASFTFTPDEIRNYKFRGSWTRTGSPSICPGTNLNWQQAVSDLTVVSLPTATLSGGATDVCAGSPVPLSVILTGTPPWSVTYTNGTAPITLENILESPGTVEVNPPEGTSVYTITSVTDAYCQNTGSGSATITAIGCIIFTGEALFCGTFREANYTFTYPGELSYVKIQGCLTNFTGGDAVVNIISGQSGWTVEFNVTGDGILEGQAGPYTIRQWTPAITSNREISVEGPASSTPLVINIQWGSTNINDIITGMWSAKDAAGNILGSVNELTCQP